MERIFIRFINESPRNYAIRLAECLQRAEFAQKCYDIEASKPDFDIRTDRSLCLSYTLDHMFRKLDLGDLTKVYTKNEAELKNFWLNTLIGRNKKLSQLYAPE